MSRFPSDLTQQVQTISWNVNGLSRHQKWKTVHNVIKGLDWSVFCLQETKLDDAKLSKMRVPLVQGEQFWVPAAGSKGGLMMVVHPSLAGNILDYGLDEDGWAQTKNGVVGPVQKWFQSIVIQTPMGPVGVCNDYASQSIRGEKRLWDRIKETLDPSIGWIICGDLNFIEFGDDREGVVDEELLHVSLEWKNLRDLHLQVEDPWVTVPAARSPLSLRFSRATKPGVSSPSKARLDRFYVPTAWRDRVMSYAIIPGIPYSDHPVLMNLAVTENGIVYSKNFLQFFRMNLSLLEWEDTKSKIEEVWRRQMEFPEGGGVADFLIAQDKTRKICREAGIRKAALEKKESEKLKDELIQLQLAVEEEDHLQEEEDKLKEVVFLMEKAANREAEGWAKRAKLKWAREGDVPRKFFYSTLKKKRKAAILPSFPDVQMQDGQQPHEALKEHVKGHFRRLYAAKETSVTWEQDWLARYGELEKFVMRVRWGRFLMKVSLFCCQKRMLI